jgi:hypothetical protein
VINVLEVPTYKKRVRKVSEQAENESRKLWYNVTQALKIGDITGATKYKQTVSSVPFSVSLRACGGGQSTHTYISHTVREKICSLSSQNLNV